MYRKTGGVQAGGIILTALGGTFGIVFFILSLVGVFGGFTYNANMYVKTTVFCFVFGIPFIINMWMLGQGISMIRRVCRFKKYNKIIGTREYCNIRELAEKTVKSEKYVSRDIMKMIRKGWYTQGHMTVDKTCLVTSHRMYEEYRNLEIERTQRIEKEAELKKSREAISRQEEIKREKLPADVKKIIDEGDAYIQKIRECNDAIPGEEISAKISKIEKVVDRIFDRVEQNPGSVSDIRKLMDYYLPTTVKLLEAYEELDAQPIEGENIRASKREIEATLDTLNIAFEKLLDDMFQDTAWDVSSDISVLHTMLAQEGLTDDGLKKPEE